MFETYFAPNVHKKHVWRNQLHIHDVMDSKIKVKLTHIVTLSSADYYMIYNEKMA